MNTTNHTTRQEYAATYLGKGWSPIPIPRGEKNPGFNDWTKLRVTLEDIPKSPPAGFKGEGNIGLRLGTASGELSDVDLDAPEALAVADIFLPGTPMVAGRKTKPRSHRFYISSTPLLTKPFRDPLIKDPKQAMLLELRANAATGNPHQTVVPPSLHKATGELVSWDGPLDPALVDAQELMTSVTHAAVCSLVARYWKAKLYPHGHDLGMALAGALLRVAEMKVDAVQRIVLAAARYAGYSKAHELASAVEDTARNLDEGKRVTGWPRLAELLDPKVTRRLQEWLGAATAAEVKATSTLDKPELRFPQRAMIGSLGAFAEVMAAGTEVPEEFYFAAALTLFGNACAKRLRVNANVACEPRLYTVLLGESYDVKKSTALHRTTDFFRQLWTDPPAFSYGVGSAEGLAKTMVDNPSTVICYDELRAFLDKTKVTGSVLLPMVTSLFEMTMYQNRTKKEFLNIEDGHLSLVSCCTLATYESMWTPESLGIGLLNRLFVVVADRKPKVAWPDPPEPEKVEAVRNQLARQMQRLPLPPQPPLAFNITPEAKQRWQEWYENLPISLHARRLDTIGFRLMSILTHTSDKQTVDLEVIEAVAAILDYELRVRKLTDPVDADNVVAKLEERIRNILETHGGMYERQLKHLGNYKRYGTWLFMKALNNLTEAGEVRRTLVERGNRNSFFYSLADQMVS